MDERVKCMNSVLHASCVRIAGLLLPRLHGGAGRLGAPLPTPLGCAERGAAAESRLASADCLCRVFRMAPLL